MTEWEQDWKRREKLYEESLEAQKKHLESFNCVICGVAGTRGNLMGGRSTALCDRHANEIHEYVARLDAWTRWLEVQAWYDAAIRKGHAVLANKARDKALQELYALTGQWIEEKRKEVLVPQPRFSQTSKEDEDG